MNRVILIGRWAQDIELRYTSAGNAVAASNLAVERDFPNSEGKKEVDFIQVEMWKKLGENTAVGRMQTQSWSDKEGNKRYKTNVVADSVKFLDYAKDKADNKPSGGVDGTELPYDDLPF